MNRSGKKSTKSNPLNDSRKDKEKLLVFYPPLKCLLLNDVSVLTSQSKQVQASRPAMKLATKAPLSTSLTTIPETNEDFPKKKKALRPTPSNHLLTAL